MTMLRRTPPDQPAPPEKAEHGTVKDGDGATRRFTNVSWRPFDSRSSEKPQRDGGYLFTITLAFVLLIAVAAATMYVSFAAQVDYVQSVKGTGKDEKLSVYLAAISWDLAALVFSLLGLATAMRGDSALRARMGNLACIAASIAMNGAKASLDQPETLLVWVGPPLLYAAVSDTIILEIQRRAMQKRGLPLEHASIWSVIGLLLRAFVGVIAWILRVIFAPVETIKKFREWYLAEVAYAPGRTIAGDKAKEAELRAGSAEEVAARVRSESATAIAAAESTATHKIQEAETAAAEKIAATEAAAAKQVKAATAEQTARADAAIAREQAKRERLEKQHTDQTKGFNSQITQLTADLDGVRADLGQAQAAAEQGRGYERALGEARRELDRVRRLRAQEQSTSTHQQQELENLFVLLSGRQQVEYLYARMLREGDQRHGRPEYVAEIADELIRQGVGVESTATVARYLREALAESGRESNGVAPVSAGSIGGGL